MDAELTNARESQRSLEERREDDHLQETPAMKN